VSGFDGGKAEGEDALRVDEYDRAGEPGIRPVGRVRGFVDGFTPAADLDEPGSPRVRGGEVVDDERGLLVRSDVAVLLLLSIRCPAMSMVSGAGL
jgi:hypothetical protein